METKSGLRFILDLLSTAAIVIACVAVGWNTLRGARIETSPGGANPRGVSAIPVPKSPIDIGDAVFLGRREAAVGLLQFSEFQCPFCAKFALDTLPQIKPYIDRGDLAIVFKQLPLSSIHPHALLAAQIAVCADQAGLFWKVHDAFFESPATTSDEFRRRAVNAGLTAKAMDECLARGSAGSRVNADMDDARRLGVARTPAFFLGRLDGAHLAVKQVLVGARPSAEFEESIRAMLGTKNGG
jgi:protein-disulfide isomerase